MVLCFESMQVIRKFAISELNHPKHYKIIDQWIRRSRFTASTTKEVVLIIKCIS